MEQSVQYNYFRLFFFFLDEPLAGARMAGDGDSCSKGEEVLLGDDWLEVRKGDGSSWPDFAVFLIDHLPLS